MHPVLFHFGSIVIPSYGVMAALGVLLALALLRRTARIAHQNPNLLWNLTILTLFSVIAGSRLLLVILNWTIVRSHPAWLLSLAMIHHPLLMAAGALIALFVALPYAVAHHMPLLATADALIAPLALGLSFEQIGTLLAGSGYGAATTVPWAVVYTSPLAARWSGTPLFVPVHPVQAYAALAFLPIAAVLLSLMPKLRRSGDAAAIGLIAISAAVYFTEFWRDPEGRGSFLGGVLDAPQCAAIVLTLLGTVLLLQRKRHLPHALPAHNSEVLHG